MKEGICAEQTSDWLALAIDSGEFDVVLRELNRLTGASEEAFEHLVHTACSATVIEVPLAG